MKINLIKGLVLDLLIGLGFILVISPLILYWFIHGNYDRYIWIIDGPYPFSHFGGGPFQFFMYIGLFILGISIIAISIVIKGIKK